MSVSQGAAEICSWAFVTELSRSCISGTAEVGGGHVFGKWIEAYRVENLMWGVDSQVCMQGFYLLACSWSFSTGTLPRLFLRKQLRLGGWVGLGNGLRFMGLMKSVDSQAYT